MFGVTVNSLRPFREAEWEKVPKGDEGSLATSRDQPTTSKPTSGVCKELAPSPYACQELFPAIVIILFNELLNRTQVIVTEWTFGSYNIWQL